jgi:hypothetical protein
MDHPESNTAVTAEGVCCIKVGAGADQTVWARVLLPSDSKPAGPPSKPLAHYPDRTFEAATPAIIEVTMPPVIEVAAVFLLPTLLAGHHRIARDHDRIFRRLTRAGRPLARKSSHRLTGARNDQT